MKKVTIYLDETVWRTFRMACLQQNISASQQIMGLIQQYLQQQPATTAGLVPPDKGP